MADDRTVSETSTLQDDPVRPTLSSLCESPEAFSVSSDVAATNILCASGLPGCACPKIDDLLAWLDEAVREVQLVTDRNYGQYLANPSEFNHSQAQYCIRVLVTVLQTQFGVTYSPKWKGLRPNDEVPHDFGRNAGDLFIPAIMEGRGGTCGSLPVLYTAVGRRLGYPLKLVKAYRHLFVRWDDPHNEKWVRPERFNIEATGPGVHFLPDEHYLTWPGEIAPEEVAEGIYLKSLAPREELAEFVAARGHCLQANGRTVDAVQAFKWASGLAPHNRHFAAAHRVLSIHVQHLRRRHAFLNAPLPPTMGEEWPVGPHWVEGLGGHSYLIQVPRSVFEAAMPTESRLPLLCGISPLMLTSVTVQTPDFTTVTVEVPYHGSGVPMTAEWLELPGHRWALVHRPVDRFSSTSIGSRPRSSFDRPTGPILPESDSHSMTSMIRNHSVHRIEPMPMHERHAVLQGFERKRAEIQWESQVAQLPNIPRQTIPPGPTAPQIDNS